MEAVVESISTQLGWLWLLNLLTLLAAFAVMTRAGWQRPADTAVEPSVADPEWGDDLEVAVRVIGNADGPELLVSVLQDLRSQMDAVTEIGSLVYGNAKLAALAKSAWSTSCRAEMSDAIDAIRTRWTALVPLLAAAGLSGDALRFKAATVNALFRSAKLNPRSVADGDADAIARVIDLVRSGKLLTYLKGADVVWESTVAVLAAATTTAAVGVPPPPAAADALGKHSVTELKKMTEIALSKLRRK